MKKMLILVLAALPWAAWGQYYDFTATVPSGQTLFFNRVEGGAEVTYQNPLYTGSPAYDSLSGRLVLPNRVYDGTDSLTLVGVGYQAFRACHDLHTVVIPDSVRHIGQQAFVQCIYMDTLRIGAGVESIGYGAFAMCFYCNAIEVDPRNTTYDSRNSCNAIVSTLGDTLVQGCRNTVIPPSVRHIGASAFQSVILPSGFTVPDGVISIGEMAFNGCHTSAMTLPNTVDSIASNAFAGAEFTTIDMGEGVRHIGKEALWACLHLTELTIPRSVRVIGHDAFSGCPALQTVHFNADSCAVTGSVFFGFDHSAFRNCTALRTLTLGDSVRYLPEYMFYNLVGIETVSLPASLRRVADRAFMGCTGLQRVDYGGTLAAWCAIDFGEEGNPLHYAHHLYLGSVLLTAITADDSLPSIGRFSLARCTDIEVADLPDGLHEVGFGAFMGCTALRSLHLPPSLPTVGGRAFEGCTSLQSMTVDSNTAFGIHAFGGCSALQRIDSRAAFPATVGAEAFDGVDTQVPVYVPHGTRSRYLTAWAPLVNFIEEEPAGIGGQCPVARVRLTVGGNMVSADGMVIEVYDTMGRLTGKGVSVTLPKAGVYIVRVDNFTYKVMAL